MFEKMLLILILFLQAIFSGLIFLNKETSFNWSSFASFLNLLFVVIGLFWGYYKLKKEIIFKKKLDVYEKITNMLVADLHRSFYELAPFINNIYMLENSDSKKLDDYSTKDLQKTSREMIYKTSNFQTNFQVFFEFFQVWKALFSKKVDYESKFLFDLGTVFYKEVTIYQRELNDYSYLGLGKNEAELQKDKRGLIELESSLSKKSVILSNALDKFIFDMAKEVFHGLYRNKPEEKKRLFGLEIENMKDNDSHIFLTETGLKKEAYRQTDFQKQFGGFKEREASLKRYLDKN